MDHAITGHQCQCLRLTGNDGGPVVPGHSRDRFSAARLADEPQLEALVEGPDRCGGRNVPPVGGGNVEIFWGSCKKWGKKLIFDLNYPLVLRRKMCSYLTYNFCLAV